MKKKGLLVSILILVYTLNLSASDSAGVSATVRTLAEDNINTNRLSLTRGWNLVGPNTNMTLDQFKAAVGDSNLLVIQGVSTSYHKDYPDPANTFTKFEDGRGYWVKVESAKTISYPLSNINITIPLINGWNLVNPTKNLTIDEIKNQIGAENLLVIQGINTSYHKDYPDPANTFKNFEEPKGYWIKVKNSAKLKF